MKDEIYQRLFAINSQLIELCFWLNEKQHIDAATRLMPITNDLTNLVAEVIAEKAE